MTRIVASVLAALCSISTAPTQDDPVVQWFRDHAVALATPEAGNGFADMQPLKQRIGDARIVALGEATHGTREMFQMKHRVLEFLVEEMGFTAFGIEASYPDCVAINDYVQTGEGDAEQALHGQRFWTWDTEEVLALIEWMRRYNADAKHQRKIRFYGFDMQYPEPALDVALAAVEESDALAERLAPLRDRTLYTSYANLSEEKRRDLRAAVDELLRRAPADPTIHHHAVVVAQYEKMVRDRRGNGRDRAMAENAAWMLEQEGPDSRIVLWAHNLHVWRKPQSDMMGVHLREKFDDDYLTIGFSFGRGSFQARSRVGEEVVDGQPALCEHTVGPAKAGSVGAKLTATGVPLFYVGLRGAPKSGPVADWLGAAHPMRSIGAGFWGTEDAYYAPTVLTESYDALLFFAETTRARPARLTRERFKIEE